MTRALRLRASLTAFVVLTLHGWCDPAVADNNRVVFGVKPSVLPLQSAFIGYAAGSLQPYAGLDLISASIEFTDRFDGQEDRDKMGALVLIPHLGSKYYFKAERPEGTVSPYVLGSLFFSLASVDGGDGAEEGEVEFAKDLLEFWGVSAAFGAEYSFSDHFAMGGEFGLRFIRDGAKESGDPDFADEVSAAFAATYAVLTLNFRI